MSPTNKHEQIIAEAVDQKFLEDSSRYHLIVRDIAISLDFLMSASDTQFLVNYVQWQHTDTLTIQSNGHLAFTLATDNYPQSRRAWHPHPGLTYIHDAACIDEIDAPIETESVAGSRLNLRLGKKSRR